MTIEYTPGKEDDVEACPFICSWEKLPFDQELLIPENHQMAVHGTFAMDGDIHLQGTFVLRN